MASIPIKVRPNFATSAEYRVLELQEKFIAPLCEGVPTRGRKRLRDESKDVSDTPTDDNRADATTNVVFTVKGNDDEVILSTHKTTFALRRHEFSNNYYLTTADTHTVHEKVNFVCEVHPTRSRTETIRSQLQEEDMYIAVDEVDAWDVTPKPDRFAVANRPLLRTFDQLVEDSLCSRTEVAQFLTDEGALLVDGRVRLVHPKVAYEVLKAALHEVHRKATLAEALGDMGADVVASTQSPAPWGLDGFVLPQLVESLGAVFPKVIVSGVLSRFVTRVEQQPPSPAGEGDSKDKTEDGAPAASPSEGEQHPTVPPLPPPPQLHAFDQKRVMVAIAEGLINPAVTNANTGPLGTQNVSSPLNDMSKKQFLAEWRAQIGLVASTRWLVKPEQVSSAPTDAAGATTTTAPAANDHVTFTDDEMIAMLGGLIFTNNDTNSSETAVVTWCPHWRLPIALPLRVRHLLSRKARWLATELRPYIMPCLEIGSTFENAVSKYLREVRSADKSLPSTYIAA